MIYSQLRKLAEEIARASLIDYTKEELLSPQEAETFKKAVRENVEIHLSQYVFEEDVIP